MKKFITLTAAFVLALGCTAYAQDKPYKEDVLVGDVNDDGKVDAADSAAIMQKTLSNAFTLECEKYDNYMGIADIDANGKIDAQDAALVMQKTLSNSFDMTALRDKKMITAQQVFAAAQTYVTDYYAMNGKNPTDVVPEKLVELEFLSEAPKGDCKIELYDENIAWGAVKRVTLDGFVYPDDRYTYISENDYVLAGTLFSAANIYVVDQYAMYGKTPDKVTVDDLYEAGLITSKAVFGDAKIVIGGDAWVDHVVVRGVYYPMSDEEKANNASTIFSAAQTYVTDYYARYGKKTESVTVDDLVEAKLLTKRPAGAVEIVLAKDAVAAVDYVVYDGCRYPGLE